MRPAANTSQDLPDRRRLRHPAQVTDSTGATNTLTKKAYIVITNKICIVPDFGNTRTNQAQDKWDAAGFTTPVQFDPGPGNYKIVDSVHHRRDDRSPAGRMRRR